MPRPPIDGILDHTATVWRKSEALGSMRQPSGAFVAVGSIPCAVNRPTARLGNEGPGLAPIGERDLYTRLDSGIQQRDVIQFTAGPETGLTIEVDEQPTNIRGHHLESKCRIWKGTLPDQGGGGES